jgi:DNA helicase-2/ATP-dependent DNA helicase PcrA
MSANGSTPERFSLNPEQQRSVAHRDGPLLVVAGAGTGKTRVITERIRTLLEADDPVNAENILALTYTDKSAGEMKYRVVKAVGDRAENLWVSTFHKFCLEKILQTALPDLQPLENLDHWILLRRHIGELQLELFKRLQEPGEFLNDFVQFFSRCQDELVTPDDFRIFAEESRRKFEARKSSLEPDAREIAAEQVARIEELARVYQVSTRLLRERKLLTFGEQIMHSVEMLRTDRELLDRMQQQYRYVLVDEFQDTNVAQLELLWLLAGGHRNIMVVGDHNQAIYRFRGASYGSFTIFLKRFCDVHTRQAESKYVVTLSQNYRSTKRILNVAGAVIQNNDDKTSLLPPNILKTENREGEKIRIADFGTPEEEAQWIVSEIERLHDAGAPWRNFAVLYRRHTHREQVLNTLRRRHIPFVIRGYSILSSTLVRDLIAWLRLVAVPEDNIACARVLAAPYWGLQPSDLVRLAERAAKNHRRPLADELESAQNEKPFNYPGIRIPEFLQLLHALRQSARKKSACDILDELIAGLELAPLPSEADRAYLDRFVEFLQEWERKSEGTKLRDFIEYLYYFGEARGDISLKEEPADDAVRLMTVHAAKGLEFPHVFIIRLSRNDFPGGLREPEFEFPLELMKEQKPEGDFHIQEERRLFYVALTRAEQRLTLSTVVNKRKKQSAFIDDILQEPKIQKMDVTQIAPKVEVPPSEEITGSEPDSLFPAQLFGPRGAGRAYSRVALWAKAYHPPRPEPLQLSASAIDAYDRCPLKYQFQYMWSVRGGANPQMTFGNVMHSTIRQYIKEACERKSMPLADVLSIYNREWSSAGYPDDYHEQEYRKAGVDQLTAFHGTYSCNPADVLYQEKSFELPLKPGMVITGRMDQVNKLADGTVEIIDYKTGRPRDTKKAAADLQLSVYAIAAEEVLDLEPERLVLYNLMTNEAVETTRDAKALKAAKQKIAEVADMIRAGEFAPKAGFGCGFCDFKPLCPAHEQLISIAPAPKTTKQN